MLGSPAAMTGRSMLHSPTPMKRRSKSKKELMASMNKLVVNQFDDCSKASNQESLSSKLGNTVSMEESDSDSDCDNRSFFSEAISVILEVPEAAEADARSLPGCESSPKKRNGKSKKKKKKKKRDKSDKSVKKDKSLRKVKKKKKDSPDSPKSPKKKREKSGKSKKRRSRSDKSPTQGAKDKISKGREISLFDGVKKSASRLLSASDDDSFTGEAFYGSHRVKPQIRQGENEVEHTDDEKALWGDTDDEKAFGDIWEEEQTWNGWDGDNDDQSEYVEETLCDDSYDGFSYYTIQSGDEDGLDRSLHTIVSVHTDAMGFPDEADKEEDSDMDWTDKDVDRKKVSFHEDATVHETLHICDFTKKEIRKSWYGQKDYEETVEDIKEVAGNAELPRGTQKKKLWKSSSTSNGTETRGLEAWTPSGVERFRYVKEAAFRAVWDEQKKQLDRAESNRSLCVENDDEDSVALQNQETLRQSYQRVSAKSQKEAEIRAKKDEEIASKLHAKLKKRATGRRGSWEKAMGSSKRSLLGGSNHGLSDNPAAPPSCLRKQEDSMESHSEHNTRNRLWFSESARGLARNKSDRALSTSTKPDRGAFGRPSSSSSLFSKKSPERGLFREGSNSSLFGKKSPNRGLFKQMSDRSLFKDKQDQRGLFRQSSDRSLFKQGICRKNFDPIAEESDGKMKMTQRRSSDLGMKAASEMGPRRNALAV